MICFLENRAISQSFLSPSKNRSAWRFGINNWDDHQLSLNPNRKPRVQHCHIWGPVWSVFLWAIFSHAFFGDFPWQAHLHLQPSRRRLCRAGTQQSTGKEIHGDFTRQNGGLKPQKTERGAQHLKYVQRKDGNPLNSPVPHLFVQTIFGMRDKYFWDGLKATTREKIRAF